MMRLQKKTEEGFALLLAIIVSSVMLAIGVSILKISVNQINLSATSRESELAFQAAHGGIDCMSYWRNEKASEYTATSSSNPVSPSISCFGVAPTQLVTHTSNGISGVINTYKNTFSWGTPQGLAARCTETELYVVSALGGNIEMDFGDRYLGTDGVKTCRNGTVCNILISRGYNRACSEVGSSIYSVQRELTQEF